VIKLKRKRASMTYDNITVEDIIVEIKNGAFDDALTDITDSVKTRTKILAALNARSLSIGDEVTFSDAISPKYLRGLTATVVKINQKTIVVDCPSDYRYGRFSGSKKVKCPNTLIEGR